MFDDTAPPLKNTPDLSIVADDSSDHLLDATELFSDNNITGFCQVLAPSVESKRKLQLLLILYVHPPVMDEVPCLHLSAWRLLDAWEHKFVAEYILASPCVFSDRKSTRLNSSHITRSRMPSSA